MNNEYLQIYSAVDNALEFSMKQLGGCLHLERNIPDYMIDSTQMQPTDDWRYWKPIQADTKNEQFIEYEKTMGFELPTSYKLFLGYKHFIELNFGHDIIFFKHTKDWIKDNYAAAKWYGYEYTIDRELIPFADYSDWGLVCFHKNQRYQNGEYKIVLLDHEDPDTICEFKHAKYDFIDMIKEMNATLEVWKEAKRESNGL